MALGKNKKMAIKISDTSIHILIGNKNKIYETHNIALENGVCKDGTVRDTDNIIELLNEYLDVNARDVKDVSFVLRGSDIITRYIEVPILKDDALREAVNYEFRQFIPEIDEYYTNYEIIEKINTQEKKAYKILLVAATRRKIDPIVEISEGINKELDVIDVLSNTVARVLRSSDQLASEESTAVFYFGADSSTLTIIEDNILKFERNLPFGVKNIFNETYTQAAATTFPAREVERGFDDESNLTTSFQNLLSSVNNTIRYYNSDKKNKPVTNFIIICADTAVNNMEKYLEKYFELPCLLIKDPIDLGLKIKFDENFSQYIASYGLFLRNNKKLLNLNPKAIYNVKDKEKLDKLLVTLTVSVLLLMTSISVPFIIINKIMAKDIDSIEAEIVKYAEIVEKNTKLKAENSQIEYFINRVKNIENSTTKTSEILAKVNTYVPEEITFMSLSFSNSGSINISGESDTYSAIPEFLANLEMSEEFSNAKISYINPVEKTIEVSNSSITNISTRSSFLPIAMVGTYNIWEGILIASDDTQDINGQINNSQNSDGQSNNSGNNTDNSGQNASGSGQQGGGNTGTNSSGTSTNSKTNTITKYSFSISIEGVITNGSKAQEAE